VLELAARLLGSGSASINHIVANLSLVRVEGWFNMVEYAGFLHELTHLWRLGKVDLDDICGWVLL